MARWDEIARKSLNAEIELNDSMQDIEGIIFALLKWIKFFKNKVGLRENLNALVYITILTAHAYLLSKHADQTVFKKWRQSIKESTDPSNGPEVW